MRIGRAVAIAIIGTVAPTLSGAAAAATLTMEGIPPCTINNDDPGFVLNEHTAIELPHGGNSVTVDIGPAAAEAYHIVQLWGVRFTYDKYGIAPDVDRESCSIDGPTGDLTVTIELHTPSWDTLGKEQLLEQPMLCGCSWNDE